MAFMSRAMNQPLDASLPPRVVRRPPDAGRLPRHLGAHRGRGLHVGAVGAGAAGPPGAGRARHAPAAALPLRPPAARARAAGGLPRLRLHAVGRHLVGRRASTSCRCRSRWSSGCTRIVEYLRTPADPLPGRRPRLDAGRAALLREDPAAARRLRDRRLRLVLHRGHADRLHAALVATTAPACSPTARWASATWRSTSQYGLDFSPGNANTQPWSPIAYQPRRDHDAPRPDRWAAGLGAARASARFGDPSQVVVLVSWVAFVALVVHAQRTRTKSRRAWSLLAFTTVCNVVLLASARANVVGPDIAREYRYQTESAALFVIAVGLAFLPLVGAPEQNDVRETADRSRPAPGRPDRSRPSSCSPRWSRACGTSTSGRTATRREQYFATRPQHAGDGAGQAGAAGRPGVPQTLLWSYRYPENTYSPRVPEPRGPDDVPALVGGPALRLRRPGPALAPSASRRPARSSPAARAAASR